MDNPQERPQLTPQFVAGLLVGEGHFGFSLGGNRQRVLLPVMTLVMTDLETMEMVVDWARDNALPLHVRRYEARNGQRRPTLRIWVAGAKRVPRWLDVLEPHLTGAKREAASQVRRFLDSRMAKPPSADYTDDEIELVNANRRFLAAGNGRYVVQRIDRLPGRRRGNSIRVVELT